MLESKVMPHLQGPRLTSNTTSADHTAPPPDALSAAVAGIAGWAGLGEVGGAPVFDDTDSRRYRLGAGGYDAAYMETALSNSMAASASADADAASGGGGGSGSGAAAASATASAACGFHVAGGRLFRARKAGVVYDDGDALTDAQFLSLAEKKKKRRF